MGMSYREMECMTYYDLGLKIQGFQARNLMIESWFRNIANAAISPHLGKKNARTFKIEKFWPIPELDKKIRNAREITPERRKRVGASIKELLGVDSSKLKKVSGDKYLKKIMDSDDGETGSNN